MNELRVIEHQGKRVLTTQQLAQVYETDPNNIHMNYINNSDRFVAGRDFTRLAGDDLKSFKSSLPNVIGEPIKFAPVLYLWTERGANRHCKILDTDKAWQQFDVLEETYFNSKTIQPQFKLPQTFAEALRELAAAVEEKEILAQQNALMLPKAQFFDAVADSKDAIQIGDAAKVLNIKGIGRNKLFEILRNETILMNNNLPYQRYIDCGYFRTIEQKYTDKKGEPHINFKTLVYQKGLDFIRKLITKELTA